jgi:hypothetical protein
MTTNYNRTWERIKWWLYHPRYELIYLLGGVPREHNGGVVHYRNIEVLVGGLKKQLEDYQKSND